MTDTPIVADTPVPQPPTISDRVKSFVGDLARPFAIIVTSAGAAWASVVASYRVENGSDGAMLLTAVFLGVGSLYIGKAWEVTKTGKQSADVEIAKASTPTA